MTLAQIILRSYILSAFVSEIKTCVSLHHSFSWGLKLEQINALRNISVTEMLFRCSDQRQILCWKSGNINDIIQMPFLLQI